MFWKALVIITANLGVEKNDKLLEKESSKSR